MGGVPTASQVFNSIQSVNATEMTQFIKEGLTENSADYNITASAPTANAPQDVVLPTTTTAAAPAAGTAHAQSRLAMGARVSVAAALLSAALAGVMG